MRWIALLVLLLFPISAWADIGIIKLATGDASVVRGGQTIAAQEDLPIEATDVLVTGDDGRIGVTFKDNTRFAAGPNSRIVLTRYRFDAKKKKGLFISKVSRGTLAIVSGDIAKFRPDAMKVRTPSSILGVRGTKFLVKVEEAEQEQ